MNRSLILLLFFILLAFSSNIRANDQFLSESSIAIVQSHENQNKLILAVDHEVERQADLFFQEFLKSVPASDHALWQKAKKIAILKWRQLHHMSSLVKAAGPAPAYALIAGEILSTVIFPPIFTAMGMPALVAASVGIPWGAFAGAGVASWQMARLKFQIMRELSVRSLSGLDSLRRELVGYEIKNRVTTIILNEIQNGLASSYEFEVVKKNLESSQRGTKAAISIEELEKIVRSSGVEGMQYLERAYVDRVNLSLYSTKLIFFIMNNAQLLSSLNGLITARENTQVSSVEHGRARETLIHIDNLKKEVAEAIQTLEKEVSIAKEKLKRGEYNRAQYEEVVTQKKANILKLQSQRTLIVQSEYRILLRLKSTLAQGEALITLAAIEQFETEVLLEIKREILRLKTIVYDSYGVPVSRSLILRCRDLFAF